MVRFLVAAAFLIVIFADCASSSATVEEGDAANVTSSAVEDQRMCKCSGAECKCCVDIDLSLTQGPGCVKMNYISKDEGLNVYVSYGDNVLHGHRIRSGGETESCMKIVMELVLLCAKFTGVEATDDGMKACASLAPRVMYDTSPFQLGCFVMGPQGMRWLNSSIPEVVSVSEVGSAAPETEDQDGDGVTSTLSQEEELIAAVNETAEEGFAWFSSFLGFSFGKPDNESSAAPSDSASPPPSQSEQTKLI